MSLVSSVLTHSILHGGGGGDTYLEKGYGDVRQERPPFYASSAAPQDSLFSILYFHKTPILNQRWQKFPNFWFRMPKFGKFSVLNPKNWPKSVQDAPLGPKISSESSIFDKKSVQQAPRFGADLFYKPLFQNSSAAHLPFWNASTPSRILHKVMVHLTVNRLQML